MDKFIWSLHFTLVFCLNVAYSQNTGGTITYVTGISDGIAAPLRIAADRSGSLYVSDSYKKSISVFNSAGDYIDSITVVPMPISVAINNEGTLFIGDGATGNIYKYDNENGARLFYSGTKYPTSMDFGHDNILYVSDSKLQEVITLDITGSLVQTIGKGILDFPTGIAVDNNNKRILVGEHGGKGTFNPVVKIYMFDLQGNLIKSFGSNGNSDGQFYRVQDITIGRCGNIYVVDPYLGRISIFDENGNYLSKFGEGDGLPGQMNLPMDVVFDSQERLIVSSMNNGVIEFYEISDPLPSSYIKNNKSVICSGETTEIEIAFKGTAPWTFTYTVDEINPVTVSTNDNPYILTVSDPGHYEITALNDANYPGTCFSGSADITVTNGLPASFMSGDAAICAGDTADILIELTGSAPWLITYTKDGNDSKTVPATRSPYVLRVSEPGYYEISALNGGGCAGTIMTGSASIVVNPLPTAKFLDGNLRIPIDSGETAELEVELTGTAPWVFTYTVDEINPVTVENITLNKYTLSAAETGSYEITGVSDAKCSSYLGKGYPEVMLKSDIISPTSYITSGDFFICQGDYLQIPVQFTGTPPWTFTYKLDTLMTTTIYNTYDNPYIINANYEGVYSLTVMADKYIKSYDVSGNVRVIFYPTPVPDFSYIADNLEVSLLNNSLNAVSYIWDFGDGSTSTEENPLHIYEVPGIYQVSLTASNNLCQTQTLTSTINLTTVYAETVKDEIHLRIYPNPSDGKVTIEAGNINSETILQIIGINGQPVYSETLAPGIISLEISPDFLKAGIYIIKTSSGEHIKYEKLVIIN